MLDPIGVKVLQLDLIVVKQSLEERAGRNRQSVPVEGREGDDVAVERHRRILMAGHKPLRRIGPHVEKTTLDEPSMHAWVTSEWYHESMEDGGGCGEAKAMEEERKLQI